MTERQWLLAKCVTLLGAASYAVQKAYASIEAESYGESGDLDDLRRVIKTLDTIAERRHTYLSSIVTTEEE